LATPPHTLEGMTTSKQHVMFGEVWPTARSTPRSRLAALKPAALIAGIHSALRGQGWVSSYELDNLLVRAGWKRGVLHPPRRGSVVDEALGRMRRNGLVQRRTVERVGLDPRHEWRREAA